MPEEIIVLECLHKRPRAGQVDGAYCITCREYKAIAWVEDGFSIKCTTCRYSRKFGMAKLTAMHAIDRHLNKQPTHNCQLKNGRKVVQVVRGRSQLATLDFVAESTLPVDPPF